MRSTCCPYHVVNTLWPQPPWRRSGASTNASSEPFGDHAGSSVTFDRSTTSGLHVEAHTCTRFASQYTRPPLAPWLMSATSARFVFELAKTRVVCMESV